MKRREAPIVGPDVGNQEQLRPAEPVPDLDAFLDFLARVDEVCPPTPERRPLTTGNRFLL